MDPTCLWMSMEVFCGVYIIQCKPLEGITELLNPIGAAVFTFDLDECWEGFLKSRFANSSFGGNARTTIGAV